MNKTSFRVLAAAVMCLAGREAPAQFLPADAGTTVNGFQDNFTNSVRDTNWVYVGPGADHWVQTNGVLQCGPTPGDPDHLLYEAAGYNSSTQEVLIRIRVTAMPTLAGSGARAGVAVGCDPATTQGQPGSGINWHLTDLDGRIELNVDDIVGRQARMLNDYVVWGPGFTNVTAPFDIPWQLNQWYWLRLHQEGTNDSAGNNIFAKVWLGDGTEAEPTDWQVQWAQPTGSNLPRTGFAGLTGPTQNILTYIEVDYFLLKADGLPSITVTPVPTPVYINQQPQSLTQAAGKTATFTVVALGSSTLAYQWQRAAPGTNTFADVSGATSSSYTTPAVTQADDGAQFRVVVSLQSGSAPVYSLPASLTVDTAPTLISARTAGSRTNVTLVFSNPMAVPADASGFAIDHGITVSAVAAGDLPTELVLTTSPFSLATAYTVTINGVTDSFGLPLPANTQAAIVLAIELPLDLNTSVKGFQDDFNAATRDTNWTAYPTFNDIYTQTNGTLHVVGGAGLSGNANHLVYNGTYSSSTQEVLLRIKVNQFSDAAYGTPTRAGAAVASDPTGQSPGDAVNLILINDKSDFPVQGRQVRGLFDEVAWGDAIPVGAPLVWQTNTWYWLRLQVLGLDGSAGNNVFGKAWLGDGSTPEPADWQLKMSATVSPAGAVFAGICGPNGGGPTDFSVDYFLLKTPDLPAITATATAFNFGPYISITLQPTNTFVVIGQGVTFVTDAIGSTNLTYQWQSAPSGSSTFSNVTGATSATISIANVQVTNSGAQYRCVISLSDGSLTKNTDVASILTDTTPPALVFAKTLGVSNQVTVKFSKSIQVPSDASGFTIDHGVTVSGVTAGPTPDELVLATSTLTLNTDYQLTVAGVKDLIGNTLTNAAISLDFTVELPAEFGQTVSGFQDDFTAGTRNTNWQVFANGSSAQPPADPTSDNYVQQNGLLSVGPTPGNPNHLVYAPPTPYNSTTQEVLLRMRVTSFGVGPDFFAAAGVCIQTNNTRGMNWGFRNVANTSDGGQFTGPSLNTLDDYTAWGPGLQYLWYTNTWYWIRLRQEPNLSTQTNSFDIFCKVWPGDGSTPEPADWQLKWDAYGSSPGGANLTPIRGAPPNQGYAGITAGDNNAGQSFDVNYILIKADGLPSITVNSGLPAFTTTVPGQPKDLNQFVNGFQDDFTGATRNTNWIVLSSLGPTNDHYVQADGMLQVHTMDGNPNHLVYWPTAGYNSTNQEVLARIRVRSFGIGGSAIAGITVCAQTNNARGMNLLFRDIDDPASEGGAFLGRQAQILDDFTAWGPGLQILWTNWGWYWMRLRQEPNLSTDPNSYDLFAKVWPADGLTLEPGDWQISWDAYGNSPGGANLTVRGSAFPAYAGITGTDGLGLSEFDVDYILIKSDGLPRMQVSFTPLGPPAPPVIIFSEPSPGHLKLEWSGTATLQSAGTILGSWTNVPGASSGYTVPTTAAQQYYRLAQ